METEDQVLDWLANGEVGESSRCMAMWLAFGRRTREGRGAYPHDPDDMDRCLKLLHRAPGLRERLPRMAEMNEIWAALIARGDEIEAMQMEEIGLGWTKARHAPRTYALMREILNPVEKRMFTKLSDRS